MKTKLIYCCFIILFFTASNCKKKKADPHIPPDVEFKSGGNYTSGDRAVAKGDTVLVGIRATKTEDDLKSYNASFYYDANTQSTTFFNYLLNSSEIESYEYDLKIPLRTVAGTEKWVFSLVDRDGNITQKTIILTVN